MKVKIGDKIYCVEDQPIMIILDDFDKEYISNMGDQTKYCRFPEGTKVSEIVKFMEVKKMQTETKEVYFNEYCNTCRFGQLKEHEDPCHDCLNTPANMNSHKPINYEER